MSYLGKVELKSSDIRRIDVTSSTSATHTLSWVPPSEQSLIITINGVKQQNNYSISGTTLTLDTALISTDEMEVVGIQDIGTSSIPPDDSITNAMVKSDAAIDATKVADGSVTNAEFQYINSLSSNAQTQITNTVTVANAALPKAGGTMAGEISAADQVISRPEMKDYSETKVALSPAATVDIDLTAGNVFTLTADQNTTFTFSNPSPTGKSCSFTLIWTQDSSDRTIAWPASVDWAGGSAPDVTSGSAKVDIYAFFTIDEGTIWYGFQPGADMG